MSDLQVLELCSSDAEIGITLVGPVGAKVATTLENNAA